MDESQIQDVWTTLKEYLDKKHVTEAAERFVDLLADYGTSDETFKEAMGSDSALDQAINYYLDEEEFELYDDEVEDWDE